MVVESFPNYLEWLLSAAGVFALVCLAAILLGVLFGYAVAAFRHGPMEAFYVVAQVISEAIPDFFGTSLRRTLAMARLAIKEALRRRVILVTFGIFALALLFGGWFMNAGSDKPDQVYINFVLWGTQLLTLLVGLLISAFSLPEDIKNRTIYTIVTKPVRATEIILGRILGFGLLATGLLVAMGVLSFFFVWSGLAHTHLLADTSTQTIDAFTPIDPATGLSKDGKRVPENAIMEGRTNTVNGHSHRILLVENVRDKDDVLLDDSNVYKTRELPDGKIAYQRFICEATAGHSHQVFVDGEGESARIRLGPAIGYFRARVPIYADQLLFYDRDGALKEKGLDVGKEWQYRGYVDGGSVLVPNSLSKAQFTFENFTEGRVGRILETGSLPLEMTLGVFRTYKGDIEQRVIASYQFESVPDDPQQDNKFISDPIKFETNEYSVQTLKVERKMKGRVVDPEGVTVDQGEYDMFKDFSKNGKIRLLLACEEWNQYLGVARGDLYFRAFDSVYWWNFIKGYIGIWCQMIVIIAIGVTLSTFLSAPIVIIGTFSILILGSFSNFIRNMTEKDVSGGGPIESFYRLITQKNMEVQLEPGMATSTMTTVDGILVQMLSALTYLAPDFQNLNFADFLTYGYSVDGHRIGVAVTVTLAFCVGLSIVGYFSLKTREIAK